MSKGRMDRGALGTIAKYDELTFRNSLHDGFTWGVCEAAGRQTSPDHKAIQNSSITRLNDQYKNWGLQIVMPETFDSATVYKLEDNFYARLASFRQLGNVHSASHTAYFLIGYAAGLVYGNGPDDVVRNRIDQIKVCCQDARIREDALVEAIKRIPTQNQTAESFQIALKQTLQSCHDRVTILFLAACPDNESRIRSDKELRTLQETLQQSTFPDTYQLHDVQCCKVRDIAAALRKHKPSILHFSGHASKGILIFEDENGESVSIKTKDLAGLMKRGAQDGLRTVLLNACSTAEQSEAIANEVESVIAMKEAVDDHACIDFVRAFYGSFVLGTGVDAAFDWALTESRLLHREDIIRPLLLKGGTNKGAGEDAQKKSARKSSSLAPSKEEAVFSSAQSSGLINGGKDGKTTLKEAEVSEEESEVTEDEGI